MLSGAHAVRSIRRLLADRQGGIAVDRLPILILLVLIVVTVFEIGLAYFAALGTAKAAQLGARVAVTLPAAHPDVPGVNLPRPGAAARAGDSCFRPTGADACLDPGGPWVCDGAALGGCDAATFARITADMRRTYPPLADADVVITYAYRRLGTAGGPFVPEVNVAVRPQSYAFLTLVLSELSGAVANTGAATVAGASASAFGDTMSPG